ncbi:hypothetical protein P152DRAFT_517752 [Eremomyces bilateralis CBS 781.70]|uniref:Aldehyde dehydrogenase domain-containing protein n=1 Tax=Eremomyces bilateralis CBS 781.70 TaxID=1392243 RepID=A0A6G1FQX1_9PEZI|nr:uncharacterized protein P152DRAFT_517752 [Eremomyces bilateralis CBS 781.70]KAF1808146.1 hypothetical protein P152DRAFT_517752 [Eremomyces bilateralis CBS 781.70]
MDIISQYVALDGSRLEGRLENPTQRQEELQAMHRAILQNAQGLTNAISSDTNRGVNNSLLEIIVVLRTISQLFGQQSLSETLKREREIEKSAEDLDRYSALGNVLILADPFLPLASSIIPLACSIAAGNSTMVLLPAATPTFSKELLEVFKQSSLDAEATAIVFPESKEDAVNILATLKHSRFNGIVPQLEEHLTIFRESEFLLATPTLRVLSSVPEASIVVVTRHAQVRNATEEILQAQSVQPTLGPSSTTPIFLIDEFVLREFETETLRVLSMRQKSNSLDGSQQGLKKSNELSPDQVLIFESHAGRVLHLPGGVTMLIGDPNWKTWEYFPSLEHLFISPSRLLYVMPTTSLECTITLAGQLNPEGFTNLFLYGNPSESRYLSSFITAAATYINCIPLQSIFLPANHFPVTAVPGSLYSTARPVATGTPAAAVIPSHILAFPPVVQKNNLLAILTAEKLNPPRQRKGQNLGFFEQGAIVGLSHVLLTTSLTCMGLWLATKILLRK